MDISYCDICGQPIHDLKHVLISIAETELAELQEELKSMFFKPLGIDKKFKIERQEICNDCKNMLGVIFKEKKKGLEKAIRDIERMYSL